jgi:beta-lactamase regulating signal transducer with metallopeptidase domain
MIPTYFSEIANHLWQSTLFAAMAGVLALALRTNTAVLRYWIWLTASVKFLIPFSFLIALGSHLEWRTAPVMLAQPGLSYAVDTFGQPFADPIVSVPPVLMNLPQEPSFIPVGLFLIWVYGVMHLASARCRQWSRIRTAVRSASRVRFEAPIPVLSSSALFEPGVFGIRRPVLILPEGITNRLTSAQLGAIVTHEMCHVRRLDNLTAVFHMVIETLFWFHPLVWWISARLVAERERACDEEVLRLGSEPEAYAEGIIRVCESHVRTPIASFSGVSGSNLTERIGAIMTQRIGRPLNFGRRLLLVVAGTAAVATPIVIGLVKAPGSMAREQTEVPPMPLPLAGLNIREMDTIASRTGKQSDAQRRRFEVAWIKPGDPNARRRGIEHDRGRFAATNATLKALVGFAYDVSDHQITSGPGWINSDLFTIVAMPTTGAISDAAAGRELVRQMVQALLAERFKLEVHREIKKLPLYGGPVESLVIDHVERLSEN